MFNNESEKRLFASTLYFLKNGYFMRVYTRTTANAYLMDLREERSPVPVSLEVAESLIDEGSLEVHHQGWHFVDWTLASAGNQATA